MKGKRVSVTAKGTTKPARGTGSAAWAFLSVTVLIAPFAIWNSLLDPHNLPKLIVVEAGVALSLLALAWGPPRGRGIVLTAPRGVALLLGVGLLLGWLSLIWALNRYAAFVHAMHASMCVLAFFLFHRFFGFEGRRATFLRLLSLSGFLVALTGLLQHLEVLDLFATDQKLAATFGLRNIASQFIVFCVPALVWVVVHGSRGWWVLAPAAGLGVVFAYLFHVRSEAAWLSVGVECLLLIALGIVFLRRRRERLMPLRRGFAAAAIFLISFLVPAGLTPKGWKWQGDEAVGGFTNKWSEVREHLPAASGKAPRSPGIGSATRRLVKYEACLEMARRQPLLGVGLGNFEVHYPAVAFDLGRPTGLTLTRNFESAHNDYLQVLAELGLPGLLAAGGLIALLAGRSIRLIRAGGISVPARSASFGLVAMSTLAGFLTDALFTYPLFRALPPFLAAAFAAMLCCSVTLDEDRPPLIFRAGRPLKVLSLLLVLFAVAFGVMRGVSQYHFARQSAADREGRLKAALAIGKKARRWNPFFPYHRLLTGKELVAAGRLDEAGPLLLRFQEDFPHNPTLLYGLALYHLRRGQLHEARRLADRAREIAPRDSTIRRLVRIIADLEQQREKH